MPFLIAILLTWLTLQVQTPELAISSPQVASPSPIIIQQPIPLNVAPILPSPSIDDTTGWGELVKTGEHTYQIKVKNDDRMGTPLEILTAINDLRRRNGAQPLKINEKLCAYTQSRAEYFNKIKNIDEHVGFQKFLEEENGFDKLGFGQLGENSSYGYIMTGVHLIEFVYMRSPEHNKNQLEPKWDHACVGVSGPATNIIFATSPL